MPRQYTSIEQTCANPDCSKSFRVKAYRIKAGQGRYCSSACYGQHFGFSMRPVEVRFWAKVNKNGPIPPHRPELGACWLWTGATDINGYGQLTTGSVRDNSRRHEVASRLSYRLHFGAISDEIDVCHRCDNEPCINPSHLFLGTAHDNMVDASEKGRTTQGERNRHARLTGVQVLEIRRLYAEGGLTYRHLASAYGVHVRTIGFIVSRKTWRHL